MILVYPLATPTPPINISPIAPTGRTLRVWGWRMKALVLFLGGPMGGGIRLELGGRVSRSLCSTLQVLQVTKLFIRNEEKI
jgi:hypothetical protein